MSKSIKTAGDLRPDTRNANRGTLRGAAMVEESIERCGAGRSVLADKNGVLMAGHKTANAFIELGHDDIIVVKTDGKQLVVVQRTDLDITKDARARELAHADNRTAQIGLDWDTVTLDQDAKDPDVDLSWMWRNDELITLNNPTNRDGTAFLDETPDDDHFEGENTRGSRHAGTVGVVVLCDSEEEAKRARRDIQGMGYYTK